MTVESHMTFLEISAQLHLSCNRKVVTFDIYNQHGVAQGFAG